MTNPTPPPIPRVRVAIPDDVPRWPDVEKAMVTVLDDFLGRLMPAGYACVVPPADWEERLLDGVAIVTVQRAGGNAERALDSANLYVTVTAGTRSDAWDVMGWLRPQLHSFNGTVTNPDGTVALITAVDDMRGPQRQPALSPDMRSVTAGFTVITRLDR